MAVGDKGNYILLFEVQTTNATSIVAQLTTQPGGNYISMSGGFGGGDCTLEMKIGGVWAPMSGGVFTEAGVHFIAGSASSKAIRMVLTGATAATLTVAVTK